MADTARKNFGGGNTAWEEKSLSKYEFRWVGAARGPRSGLLPGLLRSGRHPEDGEAP